MFTSKMKNTEHKKNNAHTAEETNGYSFKCLYARKVVQLEKVPILS